MAHHAIFFRARLQQADLHATDCEHGLFREADLAEANLRDACLKEANLSHALCRHTIFIGANCTAATWDQADIADALFSHAIQPPPGAVKVGSGPQRILR